MVRPWHCRMAATVIAALFTFTPRVGAQELLSLTNGSEVSQETASPLASSFELPADSILWSSTTAAPVGSTEEIACAACPPTKPDPPKSDDSKPTYPNVRLTGFFQVDFGWFNQDEANRALLGDIENGADFRRARLAAVGDVFENMKYMIEFDFAFGNRPSFMDLWMEVREVPVLGNIRVGQFRQPFGLDALDSVRDLTFLERSLPFAFVPFRKIGVMSYDTAFDKKVTWALSTFRTNADFFGGDLQDSGGQSVAGRVTWNPIYACEGRHVLHLGGDYQFGDPGNDRTRFANFPEFFDGATTLTTPVIVSAATPLFVDTGQIPTDSFHVYDAEFALVIDSFHFQSEFIAAMIDRQDASDITLTGAYAQMGYLLTGESRPYNQETGTLGRIKPKRNFATVKDRCITGPGAWEVATRWSYLDLTDRQVVGGVLNDVTAGLNWYLNPNAKIQFNYIHAFLERPRDNDSNADVFAIRAQIDF